MSTMATVGYGDVTPIQIPEKLVAMAGLSQRSCKQYYVDNSRRSLGRYTCIHRIRMLLNTLG